MRVTTCPVGVPRGDVVEHLLDHFLVGDLSQRQPAVVQVALFAVGNELFSNNARLFGLGQSRGDALVIYQLGYEAAHEGLSLVLVAAQPAT
jgi:hypothetical protein